MCKLPKGAVCDHKCTKGMHNVKYCIVIDHNFYFLSLLFSLNKSGGSNGSWDVCAHNVCQWIHM